MKLLLFLIVVFQRATATHLSQHHQRQFTADAIRPIGFDSWIESNFPIATTKDNSINSNCVNDTMSQIAALRAELPWAVESK
jgi:hypothetical protein